jgi:hypothetical protein
VTAGAPPNPCVERTVKRRRFACHLPAAHAQRSASSSSVCCLMENLMNPPESENSSPIFAGSIEPHAQLLRTPPDGQLLYKVMKVENLLRAMVGNYLHFNRVDSYADFAGADQRDGQQLPKDLPGNASAKFEKAPKFSAADYYDQSRSRTYACCFSLENSNYIWDNYANGSALGKACMVFRFERLRALLNQTLQRTGVAVEYQGVRCHQIFSINYGTVEYVDWEMHSGNTTNLRNPIEYTYMKDKARFEQETELRISLSALGMGRFVLNDRTAVAFPPSLQLYFDFRAAFADGTIQGLLASQDVEIGLLQIEPSEMRVVINKR